MPAGKQARGRCVFCGHETTKGAMTRHLASCAARRTQNADAEGAKRAAEPLYHLRMQPNQGGDFFLDVEVRGSATLGKVDDYLRAIWLECCGHLSQFTYGGFGTDTVGKRTKVESVFEVGVELLHLYDFGTTSETRIKAVERRVGVPLTTHPLFLLARNLPPQYACIECGEPATQLCMQCVIEDETEGTFCEAHAAEHPHDDYGGLMVLVNSPRVGMCGYDGPADAPY